MLKNGQGIYGMKLWSDSMLYSKPVSRQGHVWQIEILISDHQTKNFDILITTGNTF